MALNLEASPAEQQRHREAEAAARGERVSYEDDPVGYASLHWALWPVMAEVPQLPVIPAGMWPYESPLVKRARADAGEDPHAVPEEYVEANEAALYGLMPDDATIEAARAGDVILRGSVAEGVRQAMAQQAERDAVGRTPEERQARRDEQRAQREAQAEERRRLRDEQRAQREAQREQDQRT
jgi:hypothetical protein